MDIIYAILGTFSTTLVVSSYAGPGHVFVKMRNKSSEWLSELLECFPCLVWWVTVPFALLLGLDLLEYFAVVGGAMVLYGITEL
jgi:hypothetical protein